MVFGTIVACATMRGGETALLRLSGPRTRAVLDRAGLPAPPPWRAEPRAWRLGAGSTPCLVLFYPAGRSYTGEDSAEIALPGAADLTALACARLVAAGAEQAEPGAFTRRAVASGRMSALAAEALHALVGAPDARAAEQARGSLITALADALPQLRARLLELRAQIEAGLDFPEEGISTAEEAAVRAAILELRALLARWRAPLQAQGEEPSVVLVGAPNAGKSALFVALTGAPALVSAVAGTTRDPLEGWCVIAGRRIRVVDTAGLLERPATIDAQAMRLGQRWAEHAGLILACAAPDAPLPASLQVDERTLVVATKADLGPVPRADVAVAVSTVAAPGIDALRRLLAQRLAGIAGTTPVLAARVAQAEAILARLQLALPAPELLAEDLRQLEQVVAVLTGAVADEELLTAIFSRFCIGK